jgi:hypothetical protein
MVRHLVHRLCFAAPLVALTLQGCGDSTPGSSDGLNHAPADRTALAGTLASRPEPQPGWKTTERLPAARAPLVEQYQAEESPPWLSELLHAPDPKVRIQGLEAWARQPTASLDPVTYALVDPDESVRARAQELLEQELARR